MRANDPGEGRCARTCRPTPGEPFGPPATLTALLLAALWPCISAAQQATPDTQVGDTVTHPVTGEQSTVVEILGDYAVRTDSGDVIYVWTMVDDVFTPYRSDRPVTILSATTNADTGLIDTITVDPNDPDNPPDPPEDPITLDVARNVGSDLADAENEAQGEAGEPGGDIPVTIPAGNVNVYALRRDGDDGDNGNNGYGIEICDPTGLLGCATIGYSGTDGEAGDQGPPLIRTIDASNGDIQSITDGLDGISVESRGGNGGKGGNAYGTIDGRRGGNAGRGGTVDVTSEVAIATSGDAAHGLFGLSRSGRSGEAGRPADGGSVTLTNDSAISTLGEGSHGMYALSSGGPAGDGGDSWGIVGTAAVRRPEATAGRCRS